MSLRLPRYAVLSDGRIIHAITGAEPGENENGEAGGAGTGSSDDGTNNGGGSDSKKDDSSSGEEPITQEEFEKLRARMQAADRRASDYEKKIREFEDRDKTAMQKLEGQIETLVAERDELREKLKLQRRDNAFLTTNGVSWHDAQMALSKINWELVTDSETGDVNTSALKKEIERIAKDAPFLVKSGGGSESNSGKNSGPSGHHQTGNGSGDKTPDRAALEKKYPALRR